MGQYKACLKRRIQLVYRVSQSYGTDKRSNLIKMIFKNIEMIKCFECLERNTFFHCVNCKTRMTTAIKAKL